MTPSAVAAAACSFPPPPQLLGNPTAHSQWREPTYSVSFNYPLQAAGLERSGLDARTLAELPSSLLFDPTLLVDTQHLDETQPMEGLWPCVEPSPLALHNAELEKAPACAWGNVDGDDLLLDTLASLDFPAAELQLPAAPAVSAATVPLPPPHMVRRRLQLALDPAINRHTRLPLELPFRIAV
jgi:hypothetical protein